LFSSIILDYEENNLSKEEFLSSVEAISRDMKISEQWIIISYGNNISEKFISDFGDYILWDGVATNNTISDNFIISNFSKFSRLGRFNLLACRKLSLDVITKILYCENDSEMKEKCFKYILCYQDLTSEELDRIKFIREICE